MGLKMLEPWKNPRSKKFWFRRRIPKQYLDYFAGRTEIKISLGTADYDEAKLRCQEENLRLERAWRRHLVGRVPDQLSQEQISALAGIVFDEAVAAHRANPGRPLEREQSLRQLQAKQRRDWNLIPRGQHLRLKFGAEAALFLESRDLYLVGDTYELFIREFVKAREDAETALLRKANGVYGPDPEREKFASPEVLKPNAGKIAALATFDAYAEDAGLAAKTRSAWKSKLRDLIAFVGHDDLARLTRKEVLAWKEKLQTEILPERKAKRKKAKAGPDDKPAEPKTRDRKTIRNVYLAALRATLTFAVNREDLTTNVAKGIVVKVKKKKKQREKGFTADEARGILAASLQPQPKALSAEMAAARRWVPWICAYTGARVNEITQLTPRDFGIEEGFDYIRLDATATKTGEYRKVPLHEHLLDQGLLDYVRSRKNRPLFYEPKRSRGGDGTHFRKVGERLAEWVRNTVGVTDTDVQPNHGWRHRFSSLARAVDMHVDVQNIIQGHVGERTASDYGDAWVSTAHREISKLPRYVVE
jgi:integrase